VRATFANVRLLIAVRSSEPFRIPEVLLSPMQQCVHHLARAVPIARLDDIVRSIEIVVEQVQRRLQIWVHV
jgi:hypothetical protein